ncbi:MAG TPA: preQ(1) synthase [Victivallales bacterium]|nr:preQ(1) synthase [Victivallales bacterium]HPO89939.1 preQ(1) synthase [Victivallales bacterium]HRR28684.1 preQ(1) synthase [Victivallales bacterium]HRU01252.1 preQ(1) synthase [Victivallales bacterium]
MKKKINGISLLGKSGVKAANTPNKALIECFENKFPDRDYEVIFECPEFTSLCPVTGQPDFGMIKITYIPHQKCIESKSLKLFLQSFRNYNTFHEDVVNIIRDKIIAIANPKYLEVIGIFRPRGGISLTVKAVYKKE